MERTNNREKSWSLKWLEKIAKNVVHIVERTKQVGGDDPRRIVHSMKVGFAIALVSIGYYFYPLYQGFGVDAMWAVLTVVVVFEFSVGATLGKSVNRVLATFLGGMCGVGSHKLASLSGEMLEPFLLGLSVFIIAEVTTFMRFFPTMKARFDYGLLIFILTFSLISVSAYRDDEVLDIAIQRMTTILIGSLTAVTVCIVLWPVWAGTDLHQLITSHLDELGHFFQEFGVKYFEITSKATLKDNSEASLDGFKSVIESKNNIDSLVNLARWEPRHGRFKYRHPWTQYQKIGNLTRRCACKAEALHGFLHSQIQAAKEVKEKLQEQCITMSKESGKALKELSVALTQMRAPSNAKPHIQNAKQAAEKLNMLLTSIMWKDINLSVSDVTPASTVASLLVEVVNCTEEIDKAVQELASLASFKSTHVDVDNGNEVIGTEIGISSDLAGDQGSTKRNRSFSNLVLTIDGPSSSPLLSPRLSRSQALPPASLAMAQQVAE